MSVHSSEQDYQALIAAEAAVWSAAARDLAAKWRPDWADMRRTRHYAVVDGRHIKQLLRLVQPEWQVLEIGCWSGWLSLEMARRGAHVDGIDVAAEALKLAQTYAAEHAPRGSVRYRLADINYEPLPQNHYDLVVAVGVLHHLAEVRAVLERVRAALKPNGLLFVIDPLDTPTANALLAGALLFLLPTKVRYRDKVRHLLRFRQRVVERMKASIEARGLSPFEGYGRHQMPLEILRELFHVEQFRVYNAFTGYVIANLAMPESLAIAVGHLLLPLDHLAVRLRLLQGLSYKLLARRI
ncbi:MAG: class I SAM-dependent methyltransferase [Anaerolineae bacterium]|nr:class I SAM-dependent methyltransferase [Anaerolineae bacterium]